MNVLARSRVTGRSRATPRLAIVVVAGALGCALLGAAALMLQPRLAPALYESHTLLQVGQDVVPPATSGAVYRGIMPQDVQAVAQSINTVEVAREATRKGGAAYAVEDFTARCKATQQQDTTLIVVSCKAGQADVAEQQSRAMSAAAISINDQHFAAQSKELTTNIEAQKTAVAAELKKENDRVSSLTQGGNTVDKDPRLQIAVAHINELTREMDQLNTLILELPLNRRTALYEVSGATTPTGPTTPTPLEIIAALAVLGLAIGAEIALLQTRHWQRR